MIDFKSIAIHWLFLFYNILTHILVPFLICVYSYEKFVNKRDKMAYIGNSTRRVNVREGLESFNFVPYVWRFRTSCWPSARIDRGDICLFPLARRIHLKNNQQSIFSFNLRRNELKTQTLNLSETGSNASWTAPFMHLLPVDELRRKISLPNTFKSNFATNGASWSIVEKGKTSFHFLYILISLALIFMRPLT